MVATALYKITADASGASRALDQVRGDTKQLQKEGQAVGDVMAAGITAATAAAGAAMAALMASWHAEIQKAENALDRLKSSESGLALFEGAMANMSVAERDFNRDQMQNTLRIGGALTKNDAMVLADTIIANQQNTAEGYAVGRDIASTRQGDNVEIYNAVENYRVAAGLPSIREAADKLQASANKSQVPLGQFATEAARIQTPALEAGMDADQAPALAAALRGDALAESRTKVIALLKAVNSKTKVREAYGEDIWSVLEATEGLGTAELTANGLEGEAVMGLTAMRRAIESGVYAENLTAVQNGAGSLAARAAAANSAEQHLMRVEARRDYAQEKTVAIDARNRALASAYEDTYAPIDPMESPLSALNRAMRKGLRYVSRDAAETDAIGGALYDQGLDNPAIRYLAGDAAGELNRDEVSQLVMNIGQLNERQRRTINNHPDYPASLQILLRIARATEQAANGGNRAPVERERTSEGQEGAR